MKTSTNLDKECPQTARPMHRRLLLSSAIALALNCAAAQMEVGDATTPNAGILMPAGASPTAEVGDTPTQNTFIFLPADASKPAPTTLQASEPWPEPDTSSAALEPLRHAAALGDANAGLQLMQALVDRYEARGGNDNLYEAMLWIDRFQSTDLIAHAPLMAHLASTQCTHRVVRYHWLCEKSE
ncbi:MAG: hypothetical protein ABI589_00245 [Burkholderiales bacterium]